MRSKIIGIYYILKDQSHSGHVTKRLSQAGTCTDKKDDQLSHGRKEIHQKSGQ